MGQVAPPVGTGGALGTSGSGPRGCRLSPWAVCCGNGGGVIVSTGRVGDTGLDGGGVFTTGGGGDGWGGTAWAGSAQAQPVVVGGTQHVGPVTGFMKYTPMWLLEGSTAADFSRVKHCRQCLCLDKLR